MFIEEKDLALVKSILSKYPYRFYVFGSRVKGNAKKFSDLDLCYKEPIPDAVITQMYGDFEDSDLPFKVELLSWHRCDPDFQNLIKDDLVEIHQLIV